MTKYFIGSINPDNIKGKKKSIKLGNNTFYGTGYGFFAEEAIYKILVKMGKEFLPIKTVLHDESNFYLIAFNVPYVDNVIYSKEDFTLDDIKMILQTNSNEEEPVELIICSYNEESNEFIVEEDRIIKDGEIEDEDVKTISLNIQHSNLTIHKNFIDYVNEMGRIAKNNKKKLIWLSIINLLFIMLYVVGQYGLNFFSTELKNQLNNINGEITKSEKLIALNKNNVKLNDNILNNKEKLDSTLISLYLIN